MENYDYEEPIVTQIYINDADSSVVGGDVYYATPTREFVGRVMDETDNDMLVYWNSDESSIESKDNYSLIRLAGYQKTADDTANLIGAGAAGAAYLTRKRWMPKAKSVFDKAMDVKKQMTTPAPITTPDWVNAPSEVKAPGGALKSITPDAISAAGEEASLRGVSAPQVLNEAGYQLPAPQSGNMPGGPSASIAAGKGTGPFGESGSYTPSTADVANAPKSNVALAVKPTPSEGTSLAVRPKPPVQIEPADFAKPKIPSAAADIASEVKSKGSWAKPSGKGFEAINRGVKNLKPWNAGGVTPLAEAKGAGWFGANTLGRGVTNVYNKIPGSTSLTKAITSPAAQAVGRGLGVLQAGKGIYEMVKSNPSKWGDFSGHGGGEARTQAAGGLADVAMGGAMAAGAGSAAAIVGAGAFGYGTGRHIRNMENPWGVKGETYGDTLDKSFLNSEQKAALDEAALLRWKETDKGYQQKTEEALKNKAFNTKGYSTLNADLTDAQIEQKKDWFAAHAEMSTPEQMALYHKETGTTARTPASTSTKPHGFSNITDAQAGAIAARTTDAISNRLGDKELSETRFQTRVNTAIQNRLQRASESGGTSAEAAGSAMTSGGTAAGEGGLKANKGKKTLYADNPNMRGLGADVDAAALGAAVRGGKGSADPKSGKGKLSPHGVSGGGAGRLVNQLITRGKSKEGLKTKKSSVSGEVYITDDSESVTGAEIYLANPYRKIAGKIVADSEDDMYVQWEDGEASIEPKNDYGLVIASV